MVADFASEKKAFFFQTSERDSIVKSWKVEGRRGGGSRGEKKKSEVSEQKY